MSYVVIGYSELYREVAIRVTGTVITIDHYHLGVQIRFPPRHAINDQSPWIGFFTRKIVNNREFVFAGDVAGFIVSKFLTPAERFMVWDAVQGLPSRVKQRTEGTSPARRVNVTVTGDYDYATRTLRVGTNDAFVVNAELPEQAAFAFGFAFFP